MRHPWFDLPVPRVIGHRGAAGEAPENTLVSFEHALGAGATVLESDVQPTRDGVPVLLHDERVDRTTEGSGPIDALTLEELRRLDAGHRFTSDGGQSFPFRGRGLRVPTLDEALERFPAARFNLELKSLGGDLVERVLDVIERRGHTARTLLTAEADEWMALLRRRLGARGIAAALGASRGEVARWLASLAGGGEPPGEPMALQIPVDWEGRTLVTRRLVEAAHARGVEVHVFTIDEPHEMERLLDLGVDGIVTDFPARLAEIVRRRRGF